MKLPHAELESWMRKAYFRATHDLGSSGVESFKLGELRDLIGMSVADIDALTFCDSETLGNTALRAAIASRYANGDINRVMITNGSTEANFLLHLALVEPGDEVVVLDPAYQQLASLAEGLGAKLKRWKLLDADGFTPNLNGLKKCLTKSTKLVIVNFPHNPTGTSLSREQFSNFMRLIREAGVWLLWDSAFSEMVYEPNTALPDPANQYERALSMGTLSKAFGLPGLRVGWCIAPPKVLDACAELRDYVSLHPNPLNELLAEKTIASADAVIANRMQSARENLEYCQRWTSENADLIRWLRPQGGVCSFPEINRNIDVDELCNRMIVDHGVLLVPGRCFGEPQRIRLGFGGNPSLFHEGIDRLTKQLKSYPYKPASCP